MCGSFIRAMSVFDARFWKETRLKPLRRALVNAGYLQVHSNSAILREALPDYVMKNSTLSSASLVDASIGDSSSNSHSSFEINLKLEPHHWNALFDYYGALASRIQCFLQGENNEFDFTAPTNPSAKSDSTSARQQLASENLFFRAFHRFSFRAYRETVKTQRILPALKRFGTKPYQGGAFHARFASRSGIRLILILL